LKKYTKAQADILLDKVICKNYLMIYMSRDIPYFDFQIFDIVLLN